MADLVSLTLPIKNETTGVTTPTRYDIPSGGSVTVDAALSATSENPVQNKVIKAALDGKADAADIPAVPVQSVNGQTGAVTLDADDVGAIAAPSSPTSGQFLVYNGTAWVAQTLATWQGGSY